MERTYVVELVKLELPQEASRVGDRCSGGVMSVALPREANYRVERVSAASFPSALFPREANYRVERAVAVYCRELLPGVVVRGRYRDVLVGRG